MVSNRFIKFASLLPALLIPGAVYGASPMSSIITVQGALKKAGAPVNGTCDFRFRLWDDSVAGTQAATEFPVFGTTLDEGIFTSRVDFGVDAFNGDARWLETAVKCSGDADYVVLSPRQEVTAAPHAFVNRGQHKEFNALSPSVTNGYSGNSVAAGIVGATIGGGGTSSLTNQVNGDYGVVSGGLDNVASADHSTVSGGSGNTASADGATAPGGTGNTASGVDSTAMGSGSTAAGIGSVAMGSTALALHDGSMVFKASALAATAAPFSSTAPNQFLIDASGGVGINTNAPTAGVALDVNGTLRASNIVQAGSTILVDGVLHEIRSAADLDLFVIGAPKKMTLTAAGNVGIGTLAPSSTLQVVGTTNLSDALTVDTNTLTVDATNNRVGIGTAAPSVALDVVGATKVSGALTVDTSTLAVDATNNRVGIGTAAPSVALDVVGATNVSGALTVDTTTLAVDATNNRVGIGTATPATALHLGDGDLTVDDYTSWAEFKGRRANGTIAAPTAVTTGNPLAIFGGAGYTGAAFSGVAAYVEVEASEPWSPSGIGAYMTFHTTDAGTISTPERMRIDDNGNVGIGTTLPSGKLHVVDAVGGDASVVLPTGAISSAEILDGTITSADIANDTITAADISDEPGVANNVNTGSVALSGAQQDLLSRTITVPSSGFVLAIGTCQAAVTTTCAVEFCVDQVNADFWVSNVSATQPVPYVQADMYMQQTQDAIVPITVHRLFTVTAGVHTFYFGAQEDVGAWTVSSSVLTLVFFPTSYGTTVASASAGNTAAPGEDADALPAEGFMGLDQAIPVEQLATSLNPTQPTLDPQYVQEQFGAISEQLAERNARLEDLETHNAELEARNENLEANNARLEARLTAIEALLATLAVEDGVDSVRTGKEGAR